MAVPTLTITVPDDKLTNAVQNPVSVSGTVTPSSGTTLTAWLIHAQGYRINPLKTTVSDNWSIDFGTLSYGYYLFSIYATNGGDTSATQVRPMLVGPKGS
jgi:hypothetical protein